MKLPFGIPGRPGGAPGRHGHRLDRRLHVRPRRGAGGLRHRDRHSGPAPRHADQWTGGRRAAAGHRDPAGRLQLHRGDEQRRECCGRRRQLQPAQRPARRRRGCGHRLGFRFTFPARRLHRASGLEGRRRSHRLLAGQRCRHRNLLLPRSFRDSRRAACRYRRSCRSCSTSVC